MAVPKQSPGPARAQAAGPPATGQPGAAAVLALACAGLFVIVLDATIVSVALPDIGASLHFGRSSLPWAVNAYTLAFAGALLVAGRLVANHGTRPAFLAGLGGFGLASLACGLATAPGVLLAARAAQGLAGALVMPATLTMITAGYPDTRARSRALGLWSAVGAAGAAAGTVAGGVLTDLAGWRWVFLVNVPVTLGALLVGLRVLPARAARPDAERARLDLPGALLATAGLTALVYGVLDSGGRGWSATAVVSCLAAAALLLGLFLVHQQRWAKAPLVPLSLFRTRPLSAANAVIFCLGLGFFASPVLLSAYLQDALGYSPLRAGLAFLPAAAALFSGAQAAGPLTHRFGIRAVAATGAAVAVAGFAWLTQLGPHTAYWPGIAGPQLLFGLGIGTAFTPVTIAATTVPPALGGVAAGVLNTIRQVAAALGLAILSTLAAGQPGDPAGGYDRAFRTAALAALIAAVGAVLLLPRRPAEPPPGEV